VAAHSRAKIGETPHFILLLFLGSITSWTAEGLVAAAAEIRPRSIPCADRCGPAFGIHPARCSAMKSAVYRDAMVNLARCRATPASSLGSEAT